MIQIDISNCPTTGLNRKAQMYAFRWDTLLKAVSIDVYVMYFKDSIQVVKAGINTFSITFVANNATLVDPNTGDYLPKDESGNYSADQIATGAGEYDFFILLASNGPVDIFGLIKKHMSLADQLGRYDV